ncbi:CBS domain-containing protein [Candidatus Thermokryptus mobilis]|uniref:CBS domain-containing protein n=1 Tax=Candidatus Thermokryptus mobilis TaxID=1643428 RepID=A0A0S4MWL4_9BACT|nr:CBS domain-containing protein [Candidatus Thermokryptus mobilis]CUU03376.1 CBS domain-containing protein [Candidatus Thermokryptus mobilis]
MKKVGDIVKDKTLFFVKSGETVLNVAKFMAEKNIGAVPVLSDDGKLIGIFSERDILKRVVAKGLNPAEVKVDDVMTRELMLALEEESYEECLAKMKKAGIRHLPVVDRENNLIGMVSLRDLMDISLDDKMEKIEMLHAYIYYRPPFEEK